jgi:hypothetical protein
VQKLADGEIEGAIVALEADIGDVEREIVAKDPFFLVTRPEHRTRDVDGPRHRGGASRRAAAAR